MPNAAILVGRHNFLAEGCMIPLEQLQQHAAEIKLVSLMIDNQKNGKRGETTSHHALLNENLCCPIWAVVSQALDMLSMHASKDTLVCTFKESPSLAWQTVWSADIVCTVKQAVMARCLDNEGGYPLKQVGLHLLRAGGAMAFTWTRKLHWRSNMQDIGQATYF